MAYSSLLTDNRKTLILDTSVLINLHACRYGDEILSAIPNNIVVADVAAIELNHETSRRQGEHDFLHQMVRVGTVAILKLTEAEYRVFYELTSISPSLDDGEAATIAVAASRQVFPVIDERRGRTRAAILMNGQEPGWSLDLFRHPAVASALGLKACADALYLALRDGRMRIPAKEAESVIELLGDERSRHCTCLPRYRERFLVA